MVLTATPCYVAGIGFLQLFDDDHRCDVFVTTGAIEKLSHCPADNVSFTLTATAFEEIARKKLRDGAVQNDRIWIRSLDVPEWA